MEIASKQKLAEAAKTLARSYELIQHNTTTFIPAHWDTLDLGPCMPTTDRVWLPLTRRDKQRMANKVSNVLFTNDSEITNFDIMLRQFAEEATVSSPKILIRTEQGLRVLDEDGVLVPPTGDFQANYIKHVLNEDTGDKAEVFGVIAGWLNSEEEAHSLLHHFATALAPAWSAVKYVLLIGGGRNGKSLMLTMLSDLFGTENISHVTRQQIAERLPVCVELNSKLMNIVFDGSMNYIKDSSMEKTLIAGEPGHVRMLYENSNTEVQTNALFIEGLNSEPKTRDKSGALQKRLSRFNFANTYDLDLSFEEKMRQPKMLGALLALLIDHYVKRNELATKLAQTQQSSQLQVEQLLLNSPVLQHVQWLVQQDATIITKFRKGGMKLLPLAESFMAWRQAEGFSEFSTAEVTRMYWEYFKRDRASERRNGKSIKVPAIGVMGPEVEALINMLEGGMEDGDDVQHGTVVED